MRVYLISGLLLFVALCGCKKERIEKHYTGNFVFTDHHVEWDANNGYTLDTTIVIHGTITIYSGQATSEYNTPHPVFLDIKYGNMHTVAETDKNGHFLTDHMLHGEISGGFSDHDHLQFHDSNGGLGSQYSHDVSGIRE